MGKEDDILLVGTEGEESGAWADLCDRGGAEGDGSIRIAEGASKALACLAARAPGVAILDLDIDPAELETLCRAVARRGAIGLGLARDRGSGALERALALGLAGIVVQGSTWREAEAEIDRARKRMRWFREIHRDYDRLKSEHERLRNQCRVQASRFQEEQETFFLDLSRIMTIISNIMDGIVFADRDGNITLLNPVAEDLLGIKSFLVLGKPLAGQEGRPELLRAITRDHARMSEVKECTQTVEVHHSEQDLLYVKLITTRVHDYRGQPSGILTVLKDVTAEYKTDQLKNQYLSIVAHELRTPLTGIKSFSTIMCKGVLGPLTEQQHRVMESIREQSLRLEHQIDKLINLGHLESDDYGLDKDVFRISDITSGLVAPFEQPARDRSIALTFTCEAQDQTIHGDRADLRRAIQALIENAVKFTPDGGSVDVRIAPERDGVRFSVRDTGIGIDPRYHRRIFEKFFQVEDPLTRHHGGAGLGLFVAAGIVEAHGDRIEVSSRLGQGAEFSFMLPVWKGPAREAEVGIGEQAASNK
ncbi:MAG: hypothetical protein Fur0037_19520 [Planctomycetota bacterium]